MMQEQDLQELAELVSEEAPILSLYLNLDRRSPSFEEHKLVLRQLLTQAAQQGAATGDVERIERHFDHEYDRQGRSLACFSCQTPPFWRGYSLLVSLPNTVFVGRRPLIKPLTDVWDDYGRFAIVTVDREGARALVYHLGALHDSAGTLGTEVKRHKQGGWAAQKLQRHEDQEARQNLKAAAEWANDYLERQQVNRVVLAGTEINLAEFRSRLPRSLQNKVVGTTSLDMSTTPAEAWEKAFEIACAAQKAAEASLLDEVITAARKGGAGATGLSDTLAALQEGRIYQLLVDPDLRAAGHQCKNCGAIVIDALPSCPYCGGDLIASRDVVNLAIQRAVDAGLKVSALESSAVLAENGGIAAVLRY